ncbi:MAG: hypothetical protein IKO61_01040 [Lachnospiraceae bacterium]|nr:hypothetical protein [Lachnospiraceae bacterium]
MKNVPIKVKMLIAIIPMFILTTLATLAMSFTMNTYFNKSEDLYFEKLYKINSSLINADRDFYQAFLASTQQSHLKDSETLSDVNAQKNVETYNENAQQVLDNVHAAVEIAKTNESLWTETKSEDGATFSSVYDDFEKNYAEWKKAYDPSKYIELTLNDFDNSEIAFKAARKNIDTLEGLTETWAEDENKRLEKGMGTAIMTVALPVTGISIILIIMAVIIVNSVGNGVKGVTEDLRVLATNDLTREAPIVDGNDEIGVMRRAFANMQGNLIGIVQILKDTSEGLSEACEVMDTDTKGTSESMININKASADLAHAATSQAENVEAISGNVYDLSQIIERSARTAESLSSASRDINSVIKTGNGTVEELTNINLDSKREFEGIFAAIDTIQESADKIGEASSLISGIAAQTNLLSLNASIEAARAGEAGKGFAVVADEIRKLSDASAENVQIINKLLDELQASTRGATEKSDAVKRFVKLQNESVDKTRDSFADIVTSINAVDQAVSEIDSINSELETKMSVITDKVSELSAISEENAATAEELAATSDVVEENVHELSNTQNKVNDSVDELLGIVNTFTV